MDTSKLSTRELSQRWKCKGSKGETVKYTQRSNCEHIVNDAGRNIENAGVFLFGLTDKYHDYITIISTITDVSGPSTCHTVWR